MKKYLVAVLVFVTALLCLPTESQAQYYSGYVYNNNAYLNYAIASQRAKATRRAGRSTKRTHHKRRKHHKRHARRR